MEKVGKNFWAGVARVGLSNWELVGIQAGICRGGRFWAGLGVVGVL